MLGLEHSSKIAASTIEYLCCLILRKVVHPSVHNQCIAHDMRLGWLWSTQAQTVDCTRAHVRLGEEDVRAVGLFIVATYVHRTAQGQNLLSK